MNFTKLSATQFARFSRWYAAYPKKVAKGAAIRAWDKIDPDDALTERMIDALKAQLLERDWKGEKGIFVPEWKHPATWLNGMCWDDAVEPDDPGRFALRNPRGMDAQALASYGKLAESYRGNNEQRSPTVVLVDDD